MTPGPRRTWAAPGRRGRAVAMPPPKQAAAARDPARQEAPVPPGSDREPERHRGEAGSRRSRLALEVQWIRRRKRRGLRWRVSRAGRATSARCACEGPGDHWLRAPSPHHPPNPVELPRTRLLLLRRSQSPDKRRLVVDLPWNFRIRTACSHTSQRPEEGCGEHLPLIETLPQARRFQPGR